MITNNFLLRTLTALIGGVIFIFLLITHPYSYYFLWSVIFLFCVWEWKNMFELPFVMFVYIFLALVAILVLALTHVSKQTWLLLYAIMPLFLLKKVSFIQILHAFLGIIYLGTPMYVLFIITEQEPFYLRVLFVITIVWASDISAYLIGKYFGKRLLIPRISPKKTWEGLLGSFLFSAVVIFIWFQAKWITEPKYLWIGILVMFSAPMGDLIESAIKRKAEIKDTSQLLPGHGGFLDRFDGFFFAVVTQYWIP